jgi:hypothetical protein
MKVLGTVGHRTPPEGYHFGRCMASTIHHLPKGMWRCPVPHRDGYGRQLRAKL